MAYSCFLQAAVPEIHQAQMRVLNYVLTLSFLDFWGFGLCEGEVVYALRYSRQDWSSREFRVQLGESFEKSKLSVSAGDH